MLNMSFIIFLMVVSLPILFSRPVAYKSFEQYDAATAVFGNAPGEVTLSTTTVIVAKVTHKSSILPSDIYEWLRSGFNVILAVTSSGGFICTCWCSMKYIRNDCVCKPAWFMPKSMAEYARRKEIKEERKMAIQVATIREPSSPTSSSSPSG